MTDKKKQKLFVGIGTVAGAVPSCLWRASIKSRRNWKLSIDENPCTFVFGLFYCLYIIRYRGMRGDASLPFVVS